MNKTLLIVADLGLLRAYRETHNIADRQPHLELIEAIDPKARAKFGQVLASNLAKTDPNELLGHFARAAS